MCRCREVVRKTFGFAKEFVLAFEFSSFKSMEIISMIDDNNLTYTVSYVVYIWTFSGSLMWSMMPDMMMSEINSIFGRGLF